MLKAGHVLEQGCRLSDSRLWSLQRSFYDHSGVTAWSTGKVPYRVTNNPALAGAYARVVAGYLRDLESQLNPEEPVYILEVGGGSGRGAFLFLKQWEKLSALPVLGRLKVRYVLTDFTESNLRCYQEHPCLRPFLEDGRLDVARLDAEKDRSLVLLRSGVELKPGAQANPMAFIANYVLDTLSQDVFRIEQGQLLEALVRLVCRDEVAPDDPLLVTHLEVHYDRVPVHDPYPDPAWNRVLDIYKEQLGDTYVCFPSGPARCLENMLSLSGERMLLLTIDKAWDGLEDLAGLAGPNPVLHGGAFSLTVNFHALELLIQQSGGRAFHSQPRDANLEVSAFLGFDQQAAFPELELAFHDCFDRVGPVDQYQLRREILAQNKKPNMRLCLELLRASHWDPDVLCDLGETVIEAVTPATPAQRREMRLALARLWENFFPVGTGIDVPFQIARVLFRLERFAEASAFYARSLQLVGPHAATHTNLGLCHYRLGQLQEASAKFSEALALSPGYSLAREWLIKVNSELRERG